MLRILGDRLIKRPELGPGLRKVLKQMKSAISQQPETAPMALAAVRWAVVVPVPPLLAEKFLLKLR